MLYVHMNFPWFAEKVMTFLDFWLAFKITKMYIRLCCTNQATYRLESDDYQKGCWRVIIMKMKIFNTGNDCRLYLAQMWQLWNFYICLRDYKLSCNYKLKKKNVIKNGNITSNDCTNWPNCNWHKCNIMKYHICPHRLINLWLTQIWNDKISHLGRKWLQW